jgi:hypothetical protein
MKPLKNAPKFSLKRPSDLIAAIPSFLGFHPSESLVFLCLHRPSNQIGFVLRVDLPSPEQVERFAEEMADRASADGTGRVILVCFTAQPDDAGQLPRRDLFDTVSDELMLRGVQVPEALLVRDGRWWSYTCTKPCCPRQGTPLPEVSTGDVAALEARRALGGAAVLPNREALATSVCGPRGARLAALRRCIDETGPIFVDELMTLGMDGAREHALATVRSAFSVFTEAGAALDDAVAVRILLSLEDRWVRDVLITWGVDECGGQFLAFLIALAQCAPDECSAAICTVLAAVAYQHGRGALAAVALERALAHEPEYQLARILQALLVGQVDPDEIRGLAHRARHELGEHGIGGDRPAVA